MALYTDQAFAPLDPGRDLERIAGGNETEVYRTDDRRYVVKLKWDTGGTRAEALAHARALRAAAAALAACLGPRHRLPSLYLLARASAGRIPVLVLQPL
jgi:hypothetical protein